MATNNTNTTPARETLTRGDRYAGGRYVGTTQAGVEWVARATRSMTEDEAFGRMVDNFDDNWSPIVTLRGAPATVVAEADDSAMLGAESGIRWCRRVEVGATIVRAPRVFFADLANRLRDTADEFENGDRTTDNCEDRAALVEARDARLARTLRKWAAKCARLGA